MVMALRDALEKIEKQAIRHKKKHATIKRHPKTDVKEEAASKVTHDGAGLVVTKAPAVKAQ